tara:strand:+ start:1931 stop:3571 length:1641 start_codon:yes stop_codon:yes gene_type:complete
MDKKMDKKIIYEINRIQEVMFGEKQLITEQIKSVSQFVDLMLALMSTARPWAKNASGFADEVDVIQKLVDDMVAAQPGASRTLNNYETQRQALKLMTSNDKVAEGIIDYIKMFYRPTLTKDSAGFEAKAFVDAITNNKKIREALNSDFIDDVDAAVKNIEDGTVRKIIKTQTIDRMAKWVKIKSAEDLALALDELPPFWNAVRFSLVKKTKAVWFGLGKGLWWIIKSGGIKGAFAKLALLAGIYYITEKLKDSIGTTESLLTDKGEFWNSLPPEIKQLFSLSEEDAQTKANSLFEELQKSNPSETKIENILSVEGKGSKLVVNQIAYYFEEIDEKNQVYGERNLMSIMDERLTTAFDKPLSGLQNAIGEPELGNWTSADVIKTLDNLPAVEALFLNLPADLKAIAEKGMEELGQLSTYRVTYPLVLSNGNYAIYGKQGNTMTAKQMIKVSDMLTQKGINYYESYDAFYDGLQSLSPNEFTDASMFVVVQGSVDSEGDFKPTKSSDVTSGMKKDNSTTVNDQYKALTKNLEQTYNRLINGTIGGDEE